MNILDIIGPVMVGPSSSHTAGAVRIGLVAGKLLAEPIKEAQIHLHGSGRLEAAMAQIVQLSPDFWDLQ